MSESFEEHLKQIEAATTRGMYLDISWASVLFCAIFCLVLESFWIFLQLLYLS